jgi:hypothetical protein
MVIRKKNKTAKTERGNGLIEGMTFEGSLIYSLGQNRRLPGYSKFKINM